MRKIGSLLTLLGLLPVLAYAGLTAAFRAGAIGFGDVFGQLSWLAPALAAGGAAALVGGVLLLIKRAPFPGLVALLIGLAGLGMFGSLAGMRQVAGAVPPIHDITTDTQDPPAFLATARMRTRDDNPAAYDEGQTEAQLGHYTLSPLLIERPYGEVFPLAVAAVEADGMTVVMADPQAGHIEAVATTRWFGFKDDFVLRLRDAHGLATVVDARSKSRIGRSDLGANAARIERVLADLRERTEDKQTAD